MATAYLKSSRLAAGSNRSLVPGESIGPSADRQIVYVRQADPVQGPDFGYVEVPQDVYQVNLDGGDAVDSERGPKLTERSPMTLTESPLEIFLGGIPFQKDHPDDHPPHLSAIDNKPIETITGPIPLLESDDSPIRPDGIIDLGRVILDGEIALTHAGVEIVSPPTGYLALQLADLQPYDS